MYGNHRGRGERGHGPHSGGGAAKGAGGFHRGRGRERLFEHGDLKLVVLNLLNASPSHGYEIIKAIEELAGGEYTPSPGVVYPTLTLLQDLGFAQILQDHDGKKQYGITPTGIAYLETQRETLARIHARIESAGNVGDARRAPELQRAMENFKLALHFRLSRGALDPQGIRKIAEAIDRAAIDIERS